MQCNNGSNKNIYIIVKFYYYSALLKETVITIIVLWTNDKTTFNFK